jgi:hypothetical protein
MADEVWIMTDRCAKHEHALNSCDIRRPAPADSKEKCVSAAH